MPPLIGNYLCSTPLYLVGSHKSETSLLLTLVSMSACYQPTNPVSNDGEKPFHDLERLVFFAAPDVFFDRAPSRAVDSRVSL